MPISWLDHKPHAIAVYASWPPLPSAHATLTTGRPATALPGPVFHRLDCASFCWRLRRSRLGSVLIVGCFFAGQNVGYRGIFLLLVLPGLLGVARNATHKHTPGVG